MASFRILWLRRFSGGTIVVHGVLAKPEARWSDECIPFGLIITWRRKSLVGKCLRFNDNRMKWKSGGGDRGRETPGLIGSAAVGEMRNLAAALSISRFERSRWRLRRTRDAVRKSGFGRAIAYWNFQGNRDTCLGDVATYCLSRHIAVALPNNITGQRPQRQRFCSNRHFGQWTGRSVVVYPQSPPKFRGKAIRRSCYERQSASIRAAVQDFRQRSIDVRFAAFQAAGCLVPIWETQRHQGVQILHPPLGGLQPGKMLAP